MFESSQSASAGVTEPDGAAPAQAGHRPEGSPSDIDALLDHIVRSTHEVVDRLAETAAPALRRLTSEPQDRSDYLSADTLRTGLDDWLERYRHAIRDHPVAVLAGVVAAGVLISRIRAR